MKRIGFLITLTVLLIFGTVSNSTAKPGTRYNFVISDKNIIDYKIVYYNLVYISSPTGAIYKFDPSTGSISSTVTWANSGIDMTVDNDFLIAAGSLDKELSSGRWVVRCYGSTDEIKNKKDPLIYSREFLVGGKDSKNDNNVIILISKKI